MKNIKIEETLKEVNISGFSHVSLQRNFGNQLGDITIEYSNDGEHWTESLTTWVDADSDLLSISDLNYSHIRLSGAFGNLNGELNNNGVEQISHVVLKGK